MKTATIIVLTLALAACDPFKGESRSEEDPYVPAYEEPTPPARPSTVDNSGSGAFPAPPSGLSSLPLRLDQLRTAAVLPPPISGGSLAVDAEGRHVVAADPDRDAIYVVDMKTLRVDTLRLTAGSEPGRVALDDTNAAHVALRGSGTVVRVDLDTVRIERESAVCEHPRGLAFDRAQRALLASCMDGQFVALDPATHAEQSRSTLQTDLRDVVVNAAGKRAVTRYRSAELLNLKAEGDVSRSSRPASIQLAPGVQVTGIGSRMASPTLAWRAVTAPSGHTYMLHQQAQEGEVSIVSGGYGSGCQTITTGAITEFDADGEPLRSLSTTMRGLSVDLALSPDEKWLAVASPGGYLQTQPTLQLYAVGSMQGTNSLSCSGGTTNVGAGIESQVVAVSFDAQGLLYALSREPAQLTAYRLDGSGLSTPTLMRTTTLTLDARSMRDTGHDLFHADVGRGLACASCHGEALDDGHVWTFQKIGPRPPRTFAAAS